MIEGKKRGFSLQLLKQKLLEGGFEEKDVNDAIAELNKMESVSKPMTQTPPQQTAKPVSSAQPQPLNQNLSNQNPPQKQTISPLPGLNSAQTQNSNPYFKFF